MSRRVSEIDVKLLLFAIQRTAGFETLLSRRFSRGHPAGSETARRRRRDTHAQRGQSGGGVGVTLQDRRWRTGRLYPPVFRACAAELELAYPIATKQRAETRN